METVNKTSADVLFALLENIGKKGYKTFRAKEALPLTVEINSSVKTCLGIGWFVDVSCYSFQYGDHWRTPEMQFLVYPPDKEKHSYGKVIACYYQCDTKRISQSSVNIDNAGQFIVNIPLQKEHTDFANRWLQEIKARGYLK